jgi:hypothetical protein
MKCLLLLLTIILCIQCNNKKKKNINWFETASCIELEDSLVWETYKKRADIYLQRFDGTPITGKILMLCAREAYSKYGVFIPVEFTLAQAQMESGMGRKGRSPRTNPCNIGEYSDKTVLRYTSTYDGMRAYYKFICVNYLNYGKRTIYDLFDNFVDRRGYKYAASKTYGERMERQYVFIIRFINENENL